MVLATAAVLATVALGTSANADSQTTAPTNTNTTSTTVVVQNQSAKNNQTTTSLDNQQLVASNAQTTSATNSDQQTNQNSQATNTNQVHKRHRPLHLRQQLLAVVHKMAGTRTTIILGTSTKMAKPLIVVGSSHHTVAPGTTFTIMARQLLV